MATYQYDLSQEVISRLESDYKFKQQGKYLRGYCPDCDKDEAFTKVDQPWVVFCGRSKRCGATNSVRALFPDLFENWSDRFPTTEDDPVATARAYLTHDRRFTLDIIQGAWTQGYIPLRDGSLAETVKFPLWMQEGGKEHYWQRIIDKRKVDLLPDPPAKRKKARFSPGIRYSGKCWMPPGMKLVKDDTVYIVEGIFHAIALWIHGIKAVAAFSCNNLPTDLIEQNKSLKITWVLAYDNDTAGHKAMLKFKRTLKGMDQDAVIDLAPSKDRDWDDCHRLDLLKNPNFWAECRYRGDLLQAETAQEYALIMYKHHAFGYRVFEFQNATYAAKVDQGAMHSSMNEAGLNTDEAFTRSSNIREISNCTQTLLYIEQESITNEQYYAFRIDYANAHQSNIIQLAGTHIDSPSSLNRALLNQGTGGNFLGSPKDLQTLQRQWFKHINRIHSIPWVGYDKDTQAYVYQTFAVRHGHVIEQNEDGYFDLGKQGIKTSLVSPAIHYHKEFNPQWVEHIYHAWGAKGLIVLGFWVGTLFVQQIRKRQGSWPFLELMGEPGSGKTTLLEVLWSSCGRPGYEGFDPNKSKPAGIRRTFNQVSNLPVVLIEGDYNEKRHNAIFSFDSLKPLWNGGITGTLGVAKRGNDTEEGSFQGSLIIAQNNEIVADTPMQERLVKLHTKRGSNQTATAVRRLKEAASEPEFAAFLPHAITKENTWLEAYENAFKQYHQAFNDEPRAPAHNIRLVLNHTQIMAAVATLPVLFGEHIKREWIAECMNELLNCMLERYERVRGDSSLIDEFWDIYEYINDQGEDGATPEAPLIKNRLNHSAQPTREIALNLNHFIDECRLFNQPILDTKQLKRELMNSARYRFTGKAKVWSALKHRTMSCWLFEIPQSS